MAQLPPNTFKAGVFAALLGFLASCDADQYSGVSIDRSAPTNPVTPRSAASLELSDYYSGLQSAFLTRGLLRDDGGGPGEPFSARSLVDNFENIALSEEFNVVGGRLLAGRKNTQLNRWNVPISVGLVFGDSVPLAQRASDRAFVRAYLARLARITGHTISLSSRDVNFEIFILNEDERLAKTRGLSPILPATDNDPHSALFDMQKDIYCRVLTEDKKSDGFIGFASVLVRGEHPDRMRHACFHEEIAQGLGLFNDSPAARPSIFNDDEEFGLLTSHDEMLLRILYDPRMEPGMNAETARVQAEIIATELLSGQS